MPKNKTADIAPDWKDLLDSAFQKTAKFHEIQFREKSKLIYDIFPQPVILKENNLFYDTDNTNSGNPKALISISNEIQKRVFDKNGNLYDPDLAKINHEDYPVIGLIYEGVGGSGGVIYESPLDSISQIAQKLSLPESIIFKVDIISAEGFFILSRTFLTNKQYAVNAATLLYHEFAHALGLPDGYDLKTGVPSTIDIMGDGRRKPIEMMFLDRKFTRAMGLLE